MSRVIRNEYEPDTVSPPGTTLLETLQEIGMTQAELAERTERPLKTINEIIKGKAAITPETALQLEHVLGIPARFWNNRESHYRESLAKREESDRLSKQTDWMDDVPVAKLVDLKWIRRCSTRVEQTREVLSFYGVATPGAWRQLCDGSRAAYRKARAIEGHPAAIAAWLRKGEMDARGIACEPYEEKRFRSLLPRLRSLTRIGDPAKFVPELQRLCGAARWMTPDKALIQLSARYKDDGSFWFTFFHEVAHILLHGKKAVFLDDRIGEDTDEKEKEADTYAGNVLIPAAALGKFVAAGNFTAAAIKRFADEIVIAPGIVAGRLQHDGVIGWNTGNSLKTRYRWVDDADEERERAQVSL